MQSMQSSPIDCAPFPNTYLVGCFSGHGHHVRDLNGDEEDEYDEAIVPADFKKNDSSSMIIDDVLFAEVSADYIVL